MKFSNNIFKLLSLTIVFCLGACSHNNQNNNSEPSSEDDILVPKATSDEPEFLLNLKTVLPEVMTALSFSIDNV